MWTEGADDCGGDIRSRRHGLGQVREGAVERIRRTLLAEKGQGGHPGTV